MIIDKIKDYLNSRTDITFEENPSVLDTCNIDSIVDKYYIKVNTPIKSELIIHRLNALSEFAQRLFEDLKKNTGSEDYVFKEASYKGEKFGQPKITYTNGQKETDITIKINGKEINKKGTYNKQVELEFF